MNFFSLVGIGSGENLHWMYKKWFLNFVLSLLRVSVWESLSATKLDGALKLNSSKYMSTKKIPIYV